MDAEALGPVLVTGRLVAVATLLSLPLMKLLLWLPLELLWLFSFAVATHDQSRVDKRVRQGSVKGEA